LSSIAELVPDVAYVALGSNLGDRAAHLSAARAALSRIPHSRVLAESTVEETAPLGPVEQGAFLNQMIALETELTPRALLTALQEIEQRGGRVRDVRWGPRAIDLDIVTMRDQRSDDASSRSQNSRLGSSGCGTRQLASSER
jgi:2-amino-4-hydroxy-6-hydroxymethyldihydropteridine diphosphokinase